MWPLCGVNDILPSVMAQGYLGSEVSLKISLCRVLSRMGELWASPCKDVYLTKGKSRLGFAAAPSNGEGPCYWQPQAQTGLHPSDEQLKGSEMALAWKRSWNNWNGGIPGASRWYLRNITTWLLREAELPCTVEDILFHLRTMDVPPGPAK